MRRGRGGRGVGDGADAGLVGEEPAADALHHDGAQGRARDRLEAQCLRDDRGEHAGDGVQVQDDDDDPEDQVEDRHYRHDHRRDRRDAVDAAHEDDAGGDGDDESHDDREAAARCLGVEARGEGVRDGVRLHRVEDDSVDDRHDHGEERADDGRLQSVRDVVGRSAAERGAVLHLVELAQCGLRERGRAAHDRGHPHPEDRTGPADADGECDARDVRGADAGGGGDAERPERRDLLVAVRVMTRGFADQSEHLRQEPQLDDSGADRQVETHWDEDGDEHVAQEAVDAGDEVEERIHCGIPSEVGVGESRGCRRASQASVPPRVPAASRFSPHRKTVRSRSNPCAMTSTGFDTKLSRSVDGFGSAT